MSEDLNVFPNAKPIILGADTHAASLTGSISVSLDSTSSPVPETTGSTNGNGGGAEIVIQTRTITFSDTTNFGYIEFRQFMAFPPGVQTGGYTLRLRDGGITGTILDSIARSHSSGASFNEFLNSTIINHASGATSYVLTIVDTTSVAVSRRTYAHANGTGFGVDVDDTHAAILTGINSQRTHEQAVLPA